MKRVTSGREYSKRFTRAKNDGRPNTGEDTRHENGRARLPPTAELLLDVRTPAKLAFSPDGSRIVFALHATVADEGSFVPSDLYVANTNADEGGEPTQLGTAIVERPNAGVVARTTPSCSRSFPTGSRRGTYSRTRCPPTPTPTPTSPDSPPRSTGSAESVRPGRATAAGCWCSPPITGSYGLDWTARSVNGAEPPSRPRHQETRPSTETTLPDRSCLGRRREKWGPRDQSVWEFDAGRRRHRRRHRVPRPLGIR